MKKLWMVGVLCLAGFVLVPMTSASAATFKGKCEVKGTATFSKGKLSATAAKLGYEFASKSAAEKGVECVEEGTETKRTGTATVKEGTFEGSCFGLGASEAEGKGTLELSGLEKIEFKLAFKSLLGIVALEIGPTKASENTAKGIASFFKSENEKASSCPAGVTKLEFEATVTGEL